MPDLFLVNTWLSTTKKVDAVANQLRGGNLLSQIASTVQALLSLLNGNSKTGRACKRDTARELIREEMNSF